MKFYVDTKLINNDGVINITSSLSPSEQKSIYKIRPVIHGGNAYIKTNNIWINSKTAWKNLPTIQNTQKIKLDSTLKTLTLNFEIQDTLTGKIYKTNSTLIYNNQYLNKYIQDVNSDTSQYLNTKIETLKTSSNIYTQPIGANLNLLNPNFASTMYFLLICLIIGICVSYLLLISDKMLKSGQYEKSV